MLRWAVLFAEAAAIIVLLVACGGGGGSEGDGLVTIERLDLEAAELNPLYFLNPPPEHNYPQIVAQVNGVAITGDALASRQVLIELGHRQVTEEWTDMFPQELLDLQVDRIESEDPLEKLIDDELERQAVVRLGLLPSVEEAAAAARDLQGVNDQAIAMATPEARATMMETLEQVGAPSGDWGADPDWVERVRMSRGRVKLRQQECRWEVKTVDYVNASAGHDCSDFLRQERQRAEIVYYVRWAD